MKKLCLLLIFALTTLFLSAADKPNIIVILADDFGWKDLGCYGNDYFETPNYDKLASEGVKFTQAYAPAAICSPSRAAILTGRYPMRHGITGYIKSPKKGIWPKVQPEGHVDSGNKMLEVENHLWMEHSEITIAELLKGQGYKTCYIGKWHLGPDPYLPDSQGFDMNIGGAHFGSPPSYFDPYEKKGARVPIEPRKKGEYLTAREGHEAANFIREHKDEPFLLCLFHHAVHGPIMAPEEDVERYAAKGKAMGIRHNPTYAAMVDHMDQALGTVMTALKEESLDDNTFIFFTSDNGGVDEDSFGRPERYRTSNAPLRLGKVWPYEGGIRVPAIAWMPSRIQGGRVEETAINGVDLLPTICELAGVDVPVDRSIDGVSMWSLLENNDKTSFGDRALYWHWPHYQSTVPPYSIIIEGDWKLLYYYEDERSELFNLKDDISETVDLSKSRPEKAEMLYKKLKAWLDAGGAEYPKHR